MVGVHRPSSGPTSRGRVRPCVALRRAELQRRKRPGLRGPHVQTVILTIKRPGIANTDMYEARTDALAVARRNPSRVRFEQTVRVFRAGGSLSQVTETVYGTNDLNPAFAFAIPPSALTALAADPSLNVDLDG